MNLHWKNILITNENLYNGNLTRLRESDHNWDFSHLQATITTLLSQKPDRDLYLFGNVESAQDISRVAATEAFQAPTLTAIVIPTGRVPTRTAAFHSNQTNEETIYSFEDIGYQWVRADDPCYNGRVYYLACNVDLSSVPTVEFDANKHEMISPFTITPHDIRRTQHNKLQIDFLKFNFIDGDGDACQGVWDRKYDGPLNEYLDGLVDDYFPDGAANAKASIMEVRANVVLEAGQIQRHCHPIAL